MGWFTYVTYKGPNAKKVTIKPTGEVIPTQRVWTADKAHMYSERQDYFGNRLSEQLHSTEHFVETLGRNKWEPPTL